MGTLKPDYLPSDWNASPDEVEDEDILMKVSEELVVRPSHYTSYAIEPITFIMKNGLPFWQGNIIKYTTRAGKKVYDGMDAVESEITDLRKVIRYAEMRINQLQGAETL